MGDTPSRLDRNTLIPVGLAVVALFSAVAATWHVQDVLYELRSGGAMRQSRIDAIETKLRENWNVDDMAAWLELLAAKNPGLVIPAIPRRR